MDYCGARMKPTNGIPVDSESYKVRLPKDVMKAIRIQAEKEDRTLHNMIAVLVKRGLKMKRVIA